MKKIAVFVFLAALTLVSRAQVKSMEAFVDELMKKMTVQEKIGQLNLLPSGTIQTGVSDNSPVMMAITQGQLGGVLNLKGAKISVPCKRLRSRSRA